jgi:hypothetical protein
MITYRENVNLRAANYLFSLDNDTLSTFYDKTNKVDIIQDIKKLKRFCKEMIINNGQVYRNYSYANGKNFARLYAFNGIQNIKKHFRGLLCKDITTDIDLVNAHPHILSYVCNKHNIKTPILNEYCKNRNLYIDELCLSNPSLTKEKAKELFLISTNSNKTLKQNYYFLKHYDQEMKRVQALLLAMDEYNFITQSAKKDNLLGSNLNLILCKYENEILNVIIQHLNKKNINIHSLMFDGLMIHGNYYDDYNLLNELQDVLYQKFNWDFKLSYKTHSDIIQIPDDFSFEKKTGYPELKTSFENTHLKVADKYLCENFDNVEVMKRNMLFEKYEHLSFLGEKKEESFISKWVKDSSIRLMDDMDVYPNKIDCPCNTYNLWRDFYCESLKDIPYVPDKEGLQTFLNHIKILSNHDNNVSEFIEIWLAHMIQYPQYKSLCPVLVSDQGTGKGLFIKYIARMLGNKKVMESSNPSRDIYGHFNGPMKDSFLVNINEVSRKDSLGEEGKLFALITDETIDINEKGRPQYTIKSYHRFIISTNCDDPVPTSKGDRRFIVIRCSDEMKGASEYFEHLANNCENINVIRTIYDYLKNKKIPKKLTEQHIPKTEYHEEMKESSKSKVEVFLEDLCINYEQDEIRIRSSKLYDMFKSFCNTNGYKYDYSNTRKLTTKIGRLKIDGCSAMLWKEGNISVRGWGFNLPKMRKSLGIGQCLVDCT